MSEIVIYLLCILVGMALTSAVFYFFVYSNLSKDKETLSNKNNLLEQDLKAGQEARSHLQSQLAVKDNQLAHVEQQLKEQKQEIEALNERLKKDFENIANQVVNQSSKVVQQRQEEQLKALLDPFKDKIEKFEQRVENTHKETIRDSAALKEQINQLKEMNENIGEEARNLASALKGDKKMQGDWGEQQLERILQAAGLEKETHYRKQVDLLSEDQKHQRPDYIIYLPDEKNLVVDSKVSLVAYEQYYNAEDEQLAKPFASEHVKNVKDHIARLSAVKYDELHGINSPDYVIMYMPIEGALGLAMTEDPALFEYALNRNIVLVSNNTLLATLKTVAFIWRQDLQNKNALEIARQGGALYDKFVGFVDTLKGVGKKMDGARDDYEKAMNQLYEGKGNLVKRTENLKQLGIKTTKQLPEK